MGPFDRFNDRAKRVLALAQDEAIRMHHNYIGVEHLLLGLVREGEGVAGRTLDKLGVDLLRTRAAVRTATPPGEPGPPPTEVTLTPRVQKVIQTALAEAERLGAKHVGTEHLLLALAREGESVAASVLTSFGVALEKVRQEVVSTMGQPHATNGPHHPARTEAPPGFFQDAAGHKRDWYCEDVLSGKMQVTVLYDDERVLGFAHPYPTYEIHGIVIPRAHVASLMAAEALNGDLLTSMLKGVQAVARALGLEDKGFQLQANAAAPGVTPHMHWHVVGPGLPPPER